MKTKEECEILYKEHEHLIDITIAKNFNDKRYLERHGALPDEIRQAARIGLHKACETYDESKGAAFKTHAIDNIKFSINTETRRENLRSKKWTHELTNNLSFDKELETSSDDPISLYDLVGEDEQGYNEMEEDSHMKFLLSKIEKNTTDRVWEIVKLRLEGLTVKEIGSQLGTTHQNVSAILRSHKKKIKALIAS